MVVRFKYSFGRLLSTRTTFCGSSVFPQGVKSPGFLHSPLTFVGHGPSVLLAHWRRYPGRTMDKRRREYQCGRRGRRVRRPSRRTPSAAGTESSLFCIDHQTQSNHSGWANERILRRSRLPRACATRKSKRVHATSTSLSIFHDSDFSSVQHWCSHARYRSLVYRVSWIARLHVRNETSYLTLPPARASTSLSTHQRRDVRARACPARARCRCASSGDAGG